MSDLAGLGSVPGRDGGLGEGSSAIGRLHQNLARLQPKPPVDFRFRCWDADYIGRVDEHDDGLRLRLVGDLGPLPYSAENAWLRDQFIGLVRWSRQGAQFRFVITERKRLALTLVAPLTAPLTGASILAGITRALLAARPYLAIAREQSAAAP